jgi:hypothetical protein
MNAAIEKEFTRVIGELAYAHSRYDIFRDFVEMGYCALRKQATPPGPKADEIEKQYMSVVGRHKKETIRRMPELLGLTATAIASDGEDFLGHAMMAMELKLGSDCCLTPWNVASMMAKMMLDKRSVMRMVKKKQFLTVAEPTSGSGVMVLAAADVLKDFKGFKLDRHWLVDATDIAPLCFHMTYIQLALRGVPALVRWGDSLAMTIRDTAPTAAFWSFYRHNRKAYERWLKSAVPKRPEVSLPVPAAARRPAQGSLFD